MGQFTSVNKNNVFGPGILHPGDYLDNKLIAHVTSDHEYTRMVTFADKSTIRLPVNYLVAHTRPTTTD